MATNLVLEGVDVWGKRHSYRIYNDSGRLCVSIRKKGSLRRTFVPYRTFATRSMAFSYVIERS